MNTTHPTHKFESDSHRRCTYCTRTRLLCGEPCDRHPAVVAARVRMFHLMVVRVYGRRRFRLATPEQLATAYTRWCEVAPVNWPGYHGHRIASSHAHWAEFLSAGQTAAT